MATEDSGDTDSVAADGFVIPRSRDTQTVEYFEGHVAANHWRFDPAEHDNIYVVGDVHGCIDELERLWTRLDPTAEDLVIFVGDLVRKGPDSVAVVEFVASRPNAVSVRGNNELKLLDGDVDAEPFDPILPTIADMPLVVSWSDVMVVHGGVHPDRSLAAHTPDDLLEMRSVPPGNGYSGPFWFEQYTGRPRVFFGHTVLAEPYLSEAAVGLDTGCVYSGSLTAYDWTRDELISVPAKRTYQHRPERKFLSP